jgi:hypothetical protein
MYLRLPGGQGVLLGSIVRPLGGYLSDRLGGMRVLIRPYVGAAATTAGVSALPALSLCVLLLVTGMTLLGMGNGAVFQLVAQWFPGEIGVITGVVGAAGPRRIRAVQRSRQPEAANPKPCWRLPGLRADRSRGSDCRVVRRQELGGHVQRERRRRGGWADALGRGPPAVVVVITSTGESGLVAVTRRVASQRPLRHSRHPRPRRLTSAMPSFARCVAYRRVAHKSAISNQPPGHSTRDGKQQAKDGQQIRSVDAVRTLP